MDSKDATAPSDAAGARRRAKPLVLVVALVVLVIAPLSLLVTEIEVFDLKPIESTRHYLRSYLPASGRSTPSSADTIDCHGGSASREKCITPLLHLGDFKGQDTVLYPEPIFQVDWSDQVTRADVLHLGTLQRACTTHKESVIPWNYGLAANGGDPNTVLVNRTDDQALIDALRKCASLDIYIPGSLRGQGYCEDAAAYTKYAHARMLPRWVLDLALFDAVANRTVTYHEICPRTPVLVFNHYWDGVRADKAWPATKPLYLMPNIEMFELQADHYWQADVVLCKTVVCADYITKWFAQEGNPRLTTVLYTRHTTSDVASNALAHDATVDWRNPYPHKNFTAPVFLHTAGSSSQKGTARIFDCWLARPDLPRVDVYINEGLYGRNYAKYYDEKIKASGNVHLHLTSLDAAQFGTMIANAAFFLCPSRMEGYGHYINQARAAGGLVLTPDVPPMNELITPTSGVLIASGVEYWKAHFLGGGSSHPLGLKNVRGFVSNFGGTEMCAAVDHVLTQLQVAERETRGKRARQQYLYDTAFFANKMHELRLALKPHDVEKK